MKADTYLGDKSFYSNYTAAKGYIELLKGIHLGYPFRGPIRAMCYKLNLILILIDVSSGVTLWVTIRGSHAGGLYWGAIKAG